MRGGTLLLALGAGRLPGVAAHHGPQPALPEAAGPTAHHHSPGHLPPIGTWSTSPQASNLSFANQTLRQIVHTSIGGERARLHLSNVFSNETAQIAHVHIAQQESGSSLVASTQRRVTFDGNASVAIAAGDVAISDAIHFEVPAVSNLAISLYLPELISGATCHTLASETNFIADGNVVNDPHMNASEIFKSYCFISNLDVENPSAQGAVVALGASVTEGFALPVDSNARWSDRLAARLVEAQKPIGVLNQGISGNRLLTNGVGESGLGRLYRDALTQPGVRSVILSDDPINDIGINNPDPSAGDLISGIATFINETRAAGLQAICSTMPPYEGSFYWTQDGEVKRQAVNDFVREQGNGCAAIIDQDLATHDPDQPTRFLAAYDSGDHLHPNAAGHAAIANAVDLNIWA